MNKALVDYNDVNNSETFTIVKHCDQPPVFGEELLTYDGEGNYCFGQVVFVLNQAVIIKLYLDQFRSTGVIVDAEH
jgi:hypothetical protein